MKLLMCQCRQCKAGRKSTGGRYFVRHKRKALKAEVRSRLRRGEYDDLPAAVAVGYTD